jgi:hypothetical protein
MSGSQSSEPEYGSNSMAAELVGEIRAAAQRLAVTTGKMVAYTGRGTFAREAVDATAIATRTVEAMRSIAPAGADFRLLAEPGAPTVRGDPEQMRQLVLNLVVNAAESLPREGGRVTIRLRPFDLERPAVDPVVARSAGRRACASCCRSAAAEAAPRFRPCPGARHLHEVRRRAAPPSDRMRP